MESKSKIPNPKPESTNSERPNPGADGSPCDLRERTFGFAVRVLHIASAIPTEAAGKMLADQLLRSDSSVGANVEEADGAVTRADKRKSFVVARKEVREARVRLRLRDQLCGAKVPVQEDIGQATQLSYILSSIIDKLQ